MKDEGGGGCRRKTSPSKKNIQFEKLTRKAIKKFSGKKILSLLITERQKGRRRARDRVRLGFRVGAKHELLEEMSTSQYLGC